MTFLVFRPVFVTIMAKITTTTYKSDDPAYGDMVKNLFLAQLWGVKRSEAQTLD